MSTIAKINGVAWTSVSKRNGIAVASIDSIDGIDAVSNPIPALNPAAWWDFADALTLYDATTGGSLVGSGGAVARVEDKSGNGRHATQATSGNRPIRQSGIVGGKDVGRFDGDDFLQTPSVSIFGAYTIAFVAKSTSWVAGYRGVVSHAYESSTNTAKGVAFGIAGSSFEDWAGGDYLSFGSGYLGSSNPRALGPSSSGSDFRIAAVILSSSISKIYVNGVLASTRKESAGTPATGSGTINIGRFLTTECWLGDIAEIVVFPAALSDPNRVAVESWLRAKYPGIY